MQNVIPREIGQQDIEQLDIPNMSFTLARETEFVSVDNRTYLNQKKREKLFLIPSDTKMVLEKMSDRAKTGNEIIKELKESLGDAEEEQIKKMVVPFLRSMLLSGILTSDDWVSMDNSVPQKNWKDRLKNPILEFKLIRSLDDRLGNIKLPLPSFSARTWKTMIVFYVIITCLFIFFSIRSNSALFFSLRSHHYFYILPLFLLHLVGHELAHAIMCKHVGGRVKDAGIALLYYFIPVAYVKTADTFRLQHDSRAAIAFVGPIYDLTMASISAVVVFSTFGTSASNIFLQLMVLQFTLFIFNCNPLLPSDLYRTVEGLSNQINFRSRCFEYLRCLVFRKEVPDYLRKLKRKEKVFYLVYASVSVCYIAFLFVIFFYFFFYSKLFN